MERYSDDGGEGGGGDITCSILSLIAKVEAAGMKNGLSTFPFGTGLRRWSPDQRGFVRITRGVLWRTEVHTETGLVLGCGGGKEKSPWGIVFQPGRGPASSTRRSTGKQGQLPAAKLCCLLVTNMSASLRQNSRLLGVNIQLRLIQANFSFLTGERVGTLYA